jgi:hypothetical protein
VLQNDSWKLLGALRAVHLYAYGLNLRNALLATSGHGSRSLAKNLKLAMPNN